MGQSESDSLIGANTRLKLELNLGVKTTPEKELYLT